MAAAAATLAGPLIAAALPLLQPVINSLVKRIESLFGGGTGATKLETVLQAVVPVAAQLSTAGKLPGVLDPASIATMIETVVQSLKAQGQLPAPVVSPMTAATPAIIMTSTPSWSGSFLVTIKAAP